MRNMNVLKFNLSLTMSHFFKASILTTHLFFLLSFQLLAQNVNSPYEDPDFGSDSLSRIECANELSNMAEFMKINLYDYALPSWRIVFSQCPASSKNIYISGAKIFIKLIEDEKDPQLRQAYIDTLMLIYDNRMGYFGEEGYVLGRKGIDILRFNEQEFDQAYNAFSRSTHISGQETDLTVLTGLMQTSSSMLKIDKIEQLTFLDNYLDIVNILTEKTIGGEDESKIENVRTVIDKILVSSGLRDCNTIEDIFSLRLHEMNPDIKLFKVTEQLLSALGCTNTLFYADISTKLLEDSPDPGMAYEVAKFHIRNDNYAKAAQFLQYAIDTEDKQKQKAIYQYQLAVILSSKLDNYEEAMIMARMSVENNPLSGEPYLLMATNLIAGIKDCTSEAFDNSAIYWLATDYCIKAKQVDPLLENKANESISFYKQHYPNIEEIFFRSLRRGDPYLFGCWINESTLVREN